MTALELPALPPVPLPNTLILDTNVVLDWLVFDEPDVRPLSRRIEAGDAGWLATEAMLDELRHVLDRWTHPRFPLDRPALERRIGRWAVLTPAPTIARAAGAGLCCRDPDDQKFMDFALSRPTAWLLTRDRDLLVLRRRAARAGVRVLRPSEWPEALPPAASRAPERP